MLYLMFPYYTSSGLNYHDDGKSFIRMIMIQSTTIKDLRSKIIEMNEKSPFIFMLN